MKPIPVALPDKKAALEKYSVIYLGGLPEYPKKQSGSIDFYLMPNAFAFGPTFGSKRWFAGLVIPYADVSTLVLADRTVSFTESMLGGLSSRQLNQANNIHIAFQERGVDLLLRLEMLSGLTVMGQAKKCRELLDRMRVHGIFEKFTPQREPPSQSDDVFEKISQLGKLRDQGLITETEFESKKAVLLDRL